MSSLAVLTDEQGNFIGQKDRHKLEEGDMIAIASLWVENKNNQILISKRSVYKKHDPGLWGAAAAGTIEPGETFKDNIIKEAEEEIGLKNAQVVEFQRFSYWRADGTGRYAVWFKTMVDYPIEYFKLQENEVDDIKWISKTELLSQTQEHPENFVGSPERWRKLLELSGYNKN